MWVMEARFELYLGGPITGHEDFNRSAFERAAESLEDAGYMVLSPLNVWEKYTPTFSKDHSFWMRQATKQLLLVDGVTFLPGAIYSKGCRQEYIIASALDLDIHPIPFWIQNQEYYL